MIWEFLEKQQEEEVSDNFYKAEEQDGQWDERDADSDNQ